MTFRKGTVAVDFDEGLVKAVNLRRDHWGPELLGPLNRTLFEIPEVESIQLWGEGSCATFASWASFELQEEDVPECLLRTRQEVEEWMTAE